MGRIDDAIAAFRRAYDLEVAYYRAEAIPPGLDWHHVHNLDLLATAHQHKGQMKRAEETLREAGALPPVTEYLDFNQKALATFLLGRGRWPEAREASRALAGGKWGSTRAVGQALPDTPSSPSAGATRRGAPSTPPTTSCPRCRPSSAGSP